MEEEIQDAGIYSDYSLSKSVWSDLIIRPEHNGK